MLVYLFNLCKDDFKFALVVHPSDGQQNCIPWQLHGGFSVQRGNTHSKLLTLAVTWTVFGPAIILLTNFHIEQFHGRCIKQLSCHFQSVRETALYGSSVG